MKRILLTLCVLFLAYDSASSEGRIPAVPLGHDFVLKVGQAAGVEGTAFIITFVEVLEDSRCAVDVTCVWAGNAKVELQVRQAGGESTTVVLNTELEPKAAMIGRYELRLIALAPAPRVDVPISKSDYAVTLHVSKT